MGFLDLFMTNTRTPTVTSMLPAAAINEIQNGRLPILRTQRIFLNYGENCHYIDNVIYQKEKKVRVSNRRNGGYRVPGLFKGTSIYTGSGQSVLREQSEFEQISGLLSITNQRVIFSAANDGFVYPISKLIALKPYSNAVEIQVDNKTLTVFVPDGNVVATVLHILR